MAKVKLVLFCVVSLLAASVVSAMAGDEAVASLVTLGAAAGWFGSLGTWLGYGVTAVGAASLVVQGLSVVTGMTPSKADDEFVNEAFRVLAVVQKLLDRLALNPPASKARRR